MTDTHLLTLRSGTLTAVLAIVDGEHILETREEPTRGQFGGGARIPLAPGNAFREGSSRSLIFAGECSGGTVDVAGREGGDAVEMDIAVGLGWWIGIVNVQRHWRKRRDWWELTVVYLDGRGNEQGSENVKIPPLALLP